jgi:hypothetical protein
MALKSRIEDTVSKAEGVLGDPAPEAPVVDLGDPGSNTIKMCITGWTRPRDHQMITTYDHVLTAISKALADGLPDRAEQSRAA